MKDLRLLLQDIGTEERLRVVADFAVEEIVSAPGHRSLRAPAAVESMADDIRRGDLERVLAEPILLGIFVTEEGEEGDEVVLRSVECLDGNHRLLAGLLSGAWRRIGDIPLRGLDARVNGWPAHGTGAENRWIPLDVAQASSLDPAHWSEVPKSWPAKGPTAQVSGWVSGQDPAIPEEMRGIPLKDLLEEWRAQMHGALPQEAMIQTVRECGERDERVLGVLMYGSFAKGEGDAHSDIEFWLFFDDTKDLPDAPTWIQDVAPLRECLRNEFGTHVALFENGVRGEFHFVRASRLAAVGEWANVDPVNPASWTAEKAGLEVLVDRTGTLAENVRYLEEQIADRTSPERVQAVIDGFVHWALLGASVLRRGELLRAHDALGHMHRYLLWMVRLSEGRADRHWPTPSRAAERDLSQAACDRLRACTATADASSLRSAYREVWSWAGELMDALASTSGASSRSQLLADRPYDR